MDLGVAMQVWKETLGGTISGWKRKDGYYCLFIKNGQVKGHTKAEAGGIYWEWPDELLEWEKLSDEHRIQMLEEEDYRFGAGEDWL